MALPRPATNNQTTDRSRHDLIPGWDQLPLAATTIIVRGVQTRPGRLLALGAAALGCRVCLLEPAELSLPDPFLHRTGQTPAAALSQIITEVYADVPVRILPDGSAADLVAVGEFLDRPHVLVDCTGHLPAVAESVRATVEGELQTLILAANWRGAGVVHIPSMPGGAHWEALQQLEQFAADDHGANVATALIAVGTALQEVRRLVMPLDGDLPPQPPLIRHMLPLHRPVPVPARHPEVVLVGAGGLGNPLALGLADLTDRLVIYDGDVAEESNLARCPLLVPGEPKVQALARRLPQFAPSDLIVEPIPEFVQGPEFIDRHPEATVLLAAGDNWSVRAICDDAARRVGGRLVMVNGGCSPFGATTHLCGRGSACLHHRRPDLAALVHREAVSCSDRPQGSVVSTNWLAAGLMLHLCQALRDPDFAFDGVLEYDSRSPARFEPLRSRFSCDCFSREEGVLP